MNQIKIIRANRKTISLTINNDLSIVVRAPLGASKQLIDKFIFDKSAWINKHIEIVKQRNLQRTQNKINCFSSSEIKSLKKNASLLIISKVERFSQIIGVKYGKISIKALSSRWGSCSAKRNLNFNCLLSLCPDFVVDYVVIHELCHLIHLNHSKNFWLTVEKFCPLYKDCKKWLKLNGNQLIQRLG